MGLTFAATAGMCISDRAKRVTFMTENLFSSPGLSPGVALMIRVNEDVDLLYQPKS